jgi:hypothetical protein
VSAVLDDRLRLRLELEELYADYVGVLDDGDYEAWPDFFTEECDYQVIARENFDQGLPLAAIRCESRGMLCDRVEAVRSTSMYEPRALRYRPGEFLHHGNPERRADPGVPVRRLPGRTGPRGGAASVPGAAVRLR